MKEPETLIEENSPRCPIVAVVEQDDRVAFIYLFSGQVKSFGTKACWVRNLKKAPPVPDGESMKMGLPPMLSQDYCVQKEAARPLHKEDLRIVWFEEGDGAALLEKGEILAVIPSWSGYKGFRGYARDCTGSNDLCWPLGSEETNALFDRVSRSIVFWNDWEKGTPWAARQPEYIEVLEKSFGKHDKYYAIDNNKWPPKAMLRFSKNLKTIFSTIGVSLIGQPQVEDNGPRRIELGIAISDGMNEDGLMALAGFVSGQSNLPWREITWLGKGHTISCGIMPKSGYGTEFSAMLLVENALGAPAVNFKRSGNDAIHMLWMVPITGKEKEYAISHKSDALISMLESQEVTWIFKDREEASLK
jgi:hypothetical protein